MREYGRDESRGNLLLLAGCITVALIALALPESWAQGLVAGIRRTALRPVVLLHEQGVQNNTSRFRLEAIQHSRDSLALVAQQGAVTRRENENLRALVGLRRRLSHQYVVGEILHRAVPTDSRTLLVGVGERDGVRGFDPVVTPDGLLGYVWHAGARASTVITWAHPEFRASAVSEDGGVIGVVQASSALDGRHPMLQLTGVALRDSLPTGAMIFTAGLGGVYPRGIPIGRVRSVGPDELGYERVYRLAPVANPGDASHVLVLTAPRDSVFLALPGDSLP